MIKTVLLYADAATKALEQGVRIKSLLDVKSKDRIGEAKFEQNYEKLLNDIKKPRRFTGAFDDRFQTNTTLFIFAFYFLPFIKMLISRSECANFSLDAIGNNDEGVVPK